MINTDKELHNKNYWDELADIHFKDARYQVDEFIDGKSTLRNIEKSMFPKLNEVMLLHIQCHFGLDSMSIAREYGAKVYGIDFSEKSIKQAKLLAEKTKAEVEFLCCNAYDYPIYLNVKFDVVYASYGVLTWISDLSSWIKAVKSVIKIGGELLLIDEHPFAATFGGQDTNDNLEITYPYKHSIQGYSTFNKHSYIGNGRKLSSENQVQHKWPHSISEIINTLTQEGFKILDFIEYDFSFYKATSTMIKNNNGYWNNIEYPNLSIPFTFAIKALKL